ncbi:MAG: FkbM family methyltransferase [Pseudomonadota bacterium]
MASFKRWLEARRHPWKRVALDAVAQFKRDGARDGKLYRYEDLPEAPVVWDVGGFEGTWTDHILSVRPAAQVHVFEPHPRFADALTSKFAAAPGVHVHGFAVGGADGTLALDDTGDASSAFGHTEGTLEGSVRDVAAFWHQTGLERVDLVKMNIEGGEYDLLPAMLDAGLMQRVYRLQVQFHLFDPSLLQARDAIRARLAETHICAWDYPFVWEEWRTR